MKPSETPSNPPTMDDFAKLLMDRIHQAGEASNIVYEPEKEQLRGEGERSAVLFLSNAYQEYCTAPEDAREKVFKHWVRNWFSYLRDLPEEFEDIKPDLLPVVRSRSHFEYQSLSAEVESGTPLSWPYQVLGDHFGIALVYDLPDSMRSIPQANLDTWGVTLYEALEVARDNLKRLPIKLIGPGSGEGVYLSATGDNYDASRLLLTELVYQLRVKGDPIAMIPNRDNLIVAGSEDVEGLAGMVRMAKHALNEPRPISGIALRLDGDEWTPWLPPSSHPSYKDFQEFQLQTLAKDYADQKELLDKLYEKNREDVFVATYSVVRSPEGKVFSYAAWGGSGKSLLPETDVVVLMRKDGRPVMVEGKKLLAEMGDSVESLDIYPPRYRVGNYPLQEQLGRMGNLLP